MGNLGGICSLWACHGLRIGKPWEAYALPLFLISHMFCPCLSIFEESEAETLTWAQTIFCQLYHLGPCD